jgi:hypothetical protein
MPKEWGALPSVRTYEKKGKDPMISSRYHRKKLTMRGWMCQKMKCLLLFDTKRHEEQVIYKEMQPSFCYLEATEGLY